MIFGPAAVETAIGGILAHSIQVGDKRWQKGRILDAADVVMALGHGIAEVTIARPGADDVEEDEAATRLGAALAGASVIALAATHGRVNLAAAAAGLLAVDAAMVMRINAISEDITLATLPDGARVAAGDIVATIKIIPYAVRAADLAAAIAVAGDIHVRPFRQMAAVLIQTRLAGLPAKVLAKTARVTRDRVTALGGKLTDLPACSHTIDALADALVALVRNGQMGDVVLIAGASATVDRGDVIPAALVAAGGQIERLGMPVDPGNLLCLGKLAGKPVIGLPGCARSPKRNGFDLVLESIAAGEQVTTASIAKMGAGGLLPEAERPQPRAETTGVPDLTGAVVLAAGRSSRMGGEHKLLADWRGDPLIVHVVQAIAAAGLPPPVVVLGERADDIRAALEGNAATFVVAADYANGLAHSLRAGLAAAPADWDAALICLGDMPRVDAALLTALANASGDVVVPVWNGKRGNPVRWSRQHFPALMTIDGDVGGKALLASLPTPPTEILASDDGALDDIDTPAALADLRARS